MGISELYIVKRDGKRKAFSVEKIQTRRAQGLPFGRRYATDDDSRRY